MSAARWRKRVVPILILGIVGGRAAAVDLRSDLSVLGQVRRGDHSGETEAPTNIYGEIGAERIHQGIGAETYFRVERDLATGQSATDFYLGSMRLPFKGVEMSLGRQVINEVAGGLYVADAGRVRINPGWPVMFTLFGGQPRYFEPTYSSPSLSQDEQIFGGSIRTTKLRNGSVTLGFLQQVREGDTLRQLASLSFAQSFSKLPGLPSLYGSGAYDADHQNIDLGNLGVDLFLTPARLSVNVEAGYYKPQEDTLDGLGQINQLENATFSLFSVSSMKQARAGLRYALLQELSLYGDYSYQRYEPTADLDTDGHVAAAGALWLPEGDGLEVVRAEYYVVDSGGGNVNGGRIYYDNRVYQRILFRTKLDVSYFQKATNQDDVAVSGRVGLGYVVLAGLLAEVSVEANRNPRFDDEVRFGFFLTYNLRYRGDGVQDVDPTARRIPGGRAG